MKSYSSECSTNGQESNSVVFKEASTDRSSLPSFPHTASTAAGSVEACVWKQQFVRMAQVETKIIIRTVLRIVKNK